MTRAEDSVPRLIATLPSRPIAGIILLGLESNIQKAKELQLSGVVSRAKIARLKLSIAGPVGKELSVQISISNRTGSLSPDMSEYIEEKLGKLTKIFERIESIEATVELRPELATVEVLVNAEHKHDLVARDEASTFFAAVDQAVHKMESQLRRYKERIQEHRRTPPMGGATS